MKSLIRTGIIAILLSLFCSTNVSAQNTVSGKVSDNSGKGISGASVTSISGLGGVTNADGNFSLSLPKGATTITASFIGYSSLSKGITVSGNMTVDFMLVESSGDLGEIILTTGSRSLPRS